MRVLFVRRRGGCGGVGTDGDERVVLPLNGRGVDGGVRLDATRDAHVARLRGDDLVSITEHLGTI